MAEIAQWNNAFNSGGGGGGGISVSGMQLPPTDAGTGAFAQMLAVGQNAKSARQNNLIQQERLAMDKEQTAQQMDLAKNRFALDTEAQQQNSFIASERLAMDRSKYEMEIGKETLALAKAQKEAAATKAFGQIFVNNVDPTTGEPNLQAVAAQVAETPALSEMAPGIIKDMIDMKKVNAEALKNTLDTNLTMHTNIGRRAGMLLDKAIKGEGEITVGSVSREIANAVATGDITKEYAQSLTHMLDNDPRALTVQVSELFDSSMQSKEALERYGTSELVRNGGTQVGITKKAGPGGETITPTLDASGKPVVIQDTPSSEQNSALVETQTPDGKTMMVPRGQLPAGQGPLPGGDVSMQNAAPVGGADVAKGDKPAEAAAPAGIFKGYSPERSQLMQTEVTQFTKQLDAANSDASNAASVLRNTAQAEEAFRKFTPGSGMTSVKMPMAKMFDAMGLSSVADQFAGGDLASSEVAQAAAIKSAFGAIKDLGVTNRDLSATELEMSNKSTFSPDMKRKAIAVIIANIKGAAEIKLQKQKFLAGYYAQYKENPDNPKRNLAEAEAKFNERMAARGWNIQPATVKDTPKENSDGQ